MLEERKEPGADIPRRPEAIHLYGVDCMSNSDCLSYFGDYGPTFVEWIDDSSCNILFEDECTAKRALIGRGKPLPPENSAPDTAGVIGCSHGCPPAHVIYILELAVAVPGYKWVHLHALSVIHLHDAYGCCVSGIRKRPSTCVSGICYT